MKLLEKLIKLPGRLLDQGTKNIAGATDTGMTRENNEDCFLINPDKDLFIVADGMGGHNAGEVASKNAAEMLNTHFSAILLENPAEKSEKKKDEMVAALRETSRKIYNLAQSVPQYQGMGCTVVYGLRDDNTMHICHVGDARAYRYSGDDLELLTTDHSYVMALVKSGKMTPEEARTSSLKNELSQAVGTGKLVNPDYISCALQDGDKVLFCSDGLWDMLSDAEIADVLRQDKSSKVICTELVNRANNAGGKDNISVIVVIHTAK